MRIVIALLGAAVVLAPLAASRAQVPATVDQVKFDQADRRSRALLQGIRCAQSIGMARARQEFGPLDSLGRIGQCVVVDGHSIGVFLDADSPFVSANRFAAVDLSVHTRRAAPLDTSRVLAVVRAEYAAYARGTEAYYKEKRRYSPMAFRFDGDSIEVWLIPVSLVRGPPFTLGGERGYLFTPDGRTLVRETDAFGDYRPVAVPDTGTVSIISRGTSIPSLSELVFANGLNGAGRTVAIEWGGVTSVLAGPGDRAVWVHLARRP
jgi:hypothetical protein